MPFHQIGTTVLSFFLGALASVLATAFFEWLKRPTLSIELERPPLDMHYGGGHAIAEKGRFLRVYVKNREARPSLRWLSRNAVFRCEGDITFVDLDRQNLFSEDMPGRWTGWPEPLTFVGHVGGQPIELVNPYYLSPEFRRMDVYSGAPRLLDIAVRFDDEQACYGWTTANYQHPLWRNPAWRLPQGRYLIRVNVRADAAAASAEFHLINDTAVGTFRLEPILTQLAICPGLLGLFG